MPSKESAHLLNGDPSSDPLHHSLFFSYGSNPNPSPRLSSSSSLSSSPPPLEQHLSIFKLITMLSFSFSNGNLISTYFLLILPLESTRIANTDENLKSVYLGCFIAAAGLTQLICPAVGLYSDRCTHGSGKRRVFMALGGSISAVGLCYQQYASLSEAWYVYGLSFVISMIGLNIVFSSMIGLVPDLVPAAQTGAANGVQAVLSVGGALFGFGYFYFYLEKETQGMYFMYLVVLVSSIVLTLIFVEEAPLPLTEYVQERRMITSLKWDEVKSSYYLSPSAHGDFFYVTLSRTLYYMGISAQAFFLYFLKDIVKTPDPQGATSLLAAVGQVAAALTAYPIGKWSDRQPTHRKLFIYFSCFVLAAGNFLFLFCRSLLTVVSVSFVVGMANGSYLTSDTSLAIDTIPDKKEAAKYLGIWGVASFLGTALGPMIGGPILYYFGKTEVPGVYSFEGYFWLIVLTVVYFGAAAGVLNRVGVRSGS